MQCPPRADEVMFPRLRSQNKKNAKRKTEHEMRSGGAPLEHRR